MAYFQYRAQGLEKPLHCSSNASEDVPPHTPLLWSVGPDNFQLPERTATNEYGQTIAKEPAGATSEPPAEPSAAAPVREFETVYVLEPAEWNQRYSFTGAREFVFTLPK